MNNKWGLRSFAFTAQIHKSFGDFCGYMRLRSVTVMGNLLEINLTDCIPASYSNPLAHDTENRSRVGGKV